MRVRRGGGVGDRRGWGEGQEGGRVGDRRGAGDRT